MAIGIMALYVVHKTSLAESFGLITSSGADSDAYRALMMIALTFTGLVMLYRICQPFNVLRAILFIFVTALCILVLSVNYLAEIVFPGWSNIAFTLSQLLLIVIIVQASFPISGFLIRFFDMMNPADES